MRATASSPMRCSVSYAKKSPKTGRNFVIRSATTSASSIRIIFGFWRERSIHKIGVAFDGEENPPQIGQLQHCKTIGLVGDSLFDRLGVLVEVLLPSGNDFREDREA